MRVFVAIAIDSNLRERIERFMSELQDSAPAARWVRPESLHLTLKFIGEKSDEAVEQVRRELGMIRASGFEIAIRGYGFFPAPKSARVFWVGIQAGAELAQLAKSVDEATARLGVPKEEHTFKPHLTLARGGGRSGSPHRNRRDRENRDFQKLQAKLAEMDAPEFGTMRAREFRLYRSDLLRGGARYTPLASFELQAGSGSSSDT